MKRFLSLLLSLSLATVFFAGCANTSNPAAPQDTNTESTARQSKQPLPQEGTAERMPISLWFWGAPAQNQLALRAALEDKINASQDRYELSIEFRAGVDNNIQIALSANEGPDLVYTSGPAFAAAYVQAGKLADLTPYSEKYGWKDRLNEVLYDACSVDGKLYSIGTSYQTFGVFYNKKVLEKNNWKLPETIEEMEEIMEQAKAKGLYPSVTGNRGWKPVNNNYSTLFMNRIAGPDKIYDCLSGQSKWNNPEMVEAINKSAEWYQKGYLGGSNYMDLNFDESIQLLSMEQSPFFVGPSIIFQLAINYFRGLTVDDLGFIPFPAANDLVPYPIYELGIPATIGINANTPHMDECAEILDYIMTSEFMVEITKTWPGYWGIPLKALDIPEGEMTGLSAVFCDVLQEVIAASAQGNYGYHISTFFPPATDTALSDIDMVWLGEMTAEQYLDKVDEEFAKEYEKGLVLVLPERVK